MGGGGGLEKRGRGPTQTNQVSGFLGRQAAQLFLCLASPVALISFNWCSSKHKGKKGRICQDYLMFDIWRIWYWIADSGGYPETAPTVSAIQIIAELLYSEIPIIHNSNQPGIPIIIISIWWRQWLWIIPESSGGVTWFIVTVANTQIQTNTHEKYTWSLVR